MKQKKTHSKKAWKKPVEVPKRWKIVPMQCYCSLEEFTIDGKEADRDDFGESEDRDSAHAPDWGCGDRHFTPKFPTNEVLDKYSISCDEYRQIAAELEEKLSFGRCGWCI